MDGGDWCWWTRILGYSLCWYHLILLPIESLHIGRLLGKLDIEREINQEILMDTCLVLFSSLSGISTCLEDLDLNISGVLFISINRDIDREIDREIWSSIMILIRRLWEQPWFRLGDCGEDGFGSVGIVLVSSSGDYFGWGIFRAIGSLIGISEAWSIGGYLRYRPVGRSLGSSIVTSFLLPSWSWWPWLRGTIRGL